MTIRHDDITAEWLGYAGIRLEAPDGTAVYLDPGRYGTLTGEWTPDSPDAAHPPARDYRPGDGVTASSAERSSAGRSNGQRPREDEASGGPSDLGSDGDLVLVTHDHHYDSDAIERVASDDATVVVYDAVYPRGIDRDVADLDDLPYDVVRVSDGTDRMFGDVIVRTVEAYNEPDGPHTRADGEPYHPEGTGTGYLVTLDGTTVFWPGDSDALPGHAELDVSLFCPPIGGSFTMDRREAADLAEAMDPDLVLPVHYDTFEAIETDSAAFAADVAGRGVPVVLDERE